MSPTVRGRAISEIEGAGRAKFSLDVLLWIPQLTRFDVSVLDQVEILRAYLSSIEPRPCDITLWLPSTFKQTFQVLSGVGIHTKGTLLGPPSQDVLDSLGGAPQEVLDMAATALFLDADIVVASNPDWFPYAQEFDKLELLLCDCGVLKRQCEIFVRGHEVPWAFDYMAWNQPWTTFYNLAEQRTFREGLQFMHHCHGRVDPATYDAARMLVHNRLPNLCFTRDRLLYFDIQQSAAKRAGWKRQEFTFECAYHLNFYYLLLYGGFDHLALVVNGALGLGIPSRKVGATYESFLAALQAKAPQIHSLFTAQKYVDFQKRIGALRNFAAHRGTIMPGTLYESLDQEPTPEQLDAEIARLGLDDVLRFIPPGAMQDAFRENLRFEVRLSMHKKIADGVVFLEVDGKHYMIMPMNDVGWNFERYLDFCNEVLVALAKAI